jgi:hypothetical protein
VRPFGFEHSERLANTIAPIIDPRMSAGWTPARRIVVTLSALPTLAHSIAPSIDPRVGTGRASRGARLYGGCAAIAKALTDLVSPIIDPRISTQGAFACHGAAAGEGEKASDDQAPKHLCVSSVFAYRRSTLRGASANPRWTIGSSVESGRWVRCERSCFTRSHCRTSRSSNSDSAITEDL